MKETGLYTVRIFDLSGRKIDQFMFEGLDFQFIGNNIATGIYILEIQSQQEVLFKEKLIIR